MWTAAAADLWQAVGQLYETHAQQQQLGRYCHHIIADYIIHLAFAVPASLFTTTAAGAAAAASGH